MNPEDLLENWDNYPFDEDLDLREQTVEEKFASRITDNIAEFVAVATPAVVRELEKEVAELKTENGRLLTEVVLGQDISRSKDEEIVELQDAVTAFQDDIFWEKKRKKRAREERDNAEEQVKELEEHIIKISYCIPPGPEAQAHTISDLYNRVKRLKIRLSNCAHWATYCPMNKAIELILEEVKGVSDAS